MRTGLKFAIFLMISVLCLGSLAVASSANQKKKPKKQVQLPPLPSGPQGPVPQVPLDSTPAVAPQVSYKDGQLTIVAPNSTLGDILRAVRKQTAAEMEIPSNATERVVTHLGPGPAREVVADLLNGSHFNYVLLGSPSNSSELTRVVLVAKTADTPGANAASQQPVASQMGAVSPQPGEMANVPQDSAENDAGEETIDENAEQNQAEEQQPAQPPQEQPGIKTPQQLLQEMQQRQMQMQQQQQQGQTPVPGGAYPVPQPPPPQQQ